MFIVLGAVAVLAIVVALYKHFKPACFGDSFPVSGAGNVVVNLDDKPYNISAGYVDAAGQIPSCAQYDDSVMIELVSGANGYAAKISWNVINPRMLKYQICGCGPKL